MNKPILYIDTDVSLGTPGAEIDDGAALIMLLKEKDIQISGIGSVYGNVPQHNVLMNLGRITYLMNREDIPLSSGSEEPLSGNMEWFAEWQRGYGKTPAWQLDNPIERSEDMLIRLAGENPGELTILSIGPMTNLAKAVKKMPEIAFLIKEVIVMGGSFNTDISTPEFNLKCDPEAAQIVFNAGWPLTVFGLDVTRYMLFTREMFNNLQPSNSAVQLLKDSAAHWIDRVEAMGWEHGGCSLHDAVAAAYFLDAELFHFNMVDSITINLDENEQRGTAFMRKASGSFGKTRVAIGVRVEECRDLIWSRIIE